MKDAGQNQALLLWNLAFIMGDFFPVASQARPAERLVVVVDMKLKSHWSVLLTPFRTHLAGSFSGTSNITLEITEN